jgi:hypothetical protein
MWKNGRYVDPMKTVLPRAKGLANSAKKSFQVEVDKWLPQLP